MATHSADGEADTDARLMMVPAQDYQGGLMRPVFPDTEGYPRYVGAARGPDYSVESCLKDASGS